MYGIVAAVPTPINNYGEPISKIFLAHCSWVLKHGCDGINILGSTGEANSFSTSKRKQVMEIAIKEIDKRKLMVGTGTPSLSESAYLTNFADDLGYKIALVLPPFYYKPLKNEGLFLWYKTLHEKLGDKKIKIYFYNFPQLTGINIPVDVITSLHKQWPNRFSGIKDSSGDLHYCRILAKNKNFKVFPSSEVSILDAQASHFSGCISATVNQTLFLSTNAWTNKSQDISELISQIRAIREEISKDSLVPSIKYLISLRTQDKAWQTLMPPLYTLTIERQVKLKTLYNKFLI